jgi:hypothetical protein
MLSAKSMEPIASKLPGLRWLKLRAAGDGVFAVVVAALLEA